MAAYDIPTAVHRAVLAGTDRIPTPRAQEGEVSTPLSEAERMGECGNRGPRIGSEGTPICRRIKGHEGEHRPHPDDGWGAIRWNDVAPPAADLSSAERSVVDRIEQAPDAPEALRERVARAIAEANAAHGPFGFPCKCGWLAEFGVGWEDRVRQHRLMATADAAITAMRGAR